MQRLPLQDIHDSAHSGLEHHSHGPGIALLCCLMRRPADSQVTGGLCAHLLGLARIHIVQVLPKLVRPLDDSRLRALHDHQVLGQSASRTLVKAAVPETEQPQQQSILRTTGRLKVVFAACTWPAETATLSSGL